MQIIITVTMEVAVHARPVNANCCQYADRRLLVVQCSERSVDMSFPKLSTCGCIKPMCHLCCCFETHSFAGGFFCQISTAWHRERCFYFVAGMSIQKEENLLLTLLPKEKIVYCRFHAPLIVCQFVCLCIA